MLIYLAGCMSEHDRLGYFKDATEWRETATTEFEGTHLKVFNPCINYDINKKFNTKGVVTQNLAYLKQSDIVLLNLDKLECSQGSLFEIFYSFLHDIPVIAFNNNYLYGVQPHITESISIRFDELDEALDYIWSMYLQDNN